MSKFNPAEITAALRAFFQEGDVFEVRILDATTGSNSRPHVESGYFDYGHIDAVPEALKHVYGYRGVYVTVNPPKPELLARASNRLRDIRREPITADADVPRRRWLLIDCDAKRPSGIASSETEHQAALQKAEQIQSDLAAAGWPEPLSIDSGNGAQLMFPIDLPADDNGIVKGAVAGLAARYSDEAVEIDLTVHNPARIWRLPGTFNVKGDEVGDRVHRQSRIVRRPEELRRQLVTEEQLRAIQPPTPEPSSSSSAVDISGIMTNGTTPPAGTFNLEAWIKKYAPELTNPPQPWQGGRKWVFDVCPFNDAHTNRSAVLIEQPGGAIVFKCHHNGCKDNDWHAFRAMREPEYAERLATGGRPAAVYGGELDDTTPAPEPAIAIGGGGPAPIEPKIPGPLPEELLNVPGFIQSVVDYDMRTAPYPNRVLAFAGALTLTAFLTGRKYRDRSNCMTNIYLIALANSGSGKDHPRKVNLEIANEAGMAHQIGDAIASGEGVEDAIILNRTMLFQTDEIDSLFNSINKSADGRYETIMSTLLKLYSSSNSIYIKRVLAKTRNGNNPRNETCDKPSMTLFGTAVPKFLYESLNGRMLENGFWARSLIIEAGNRGPGQEPEFTEPPRDVVATAKYFAEYIPNHGTGSGNLLDEHPQPYVIPMADGVQELYNQFRAEADEEYSRSEEKNDLAAISLWNRSFEKARKLAMLYALSENPKEPVLTSTAINWAWRLARHLTERQLFMAGSYVAENPFHMQCLNFIRRLRTAGGRMPKREMLRAMHVKVSDLEAIEQYLQSTEHIRLDFETIRGQVKTYYRLMV